MDAPTAASAPTPWWLAYPDRWAAETAALAAAGATWCNDTPDSEDSPADPAADVVGPTPARALRVHWSHPAQRPGDPATLELRVTYPAAFPWFAPRVRLPEPLPGLVRHRNPVNGVLCLLADPGDWRPDTTLAQLLGTQLPRLLTAGRSSDTDAAMVALEAGAEATWMRMRLSLGALLVDPGGLPPPEVPGGWADLARISGSVAPVSALVTVLDGEQRLLWESRVFGLREARRIRWVRLHDLPPDAVDPGELWRRAIEQLEEVVPGGAGCDEPNAVVVLVPSEAAARRPCEEWLLLTRGVLRRDGLEAAVEQVEPEPTGEQASDAVAGEQLELFDAAELPAPASTSTPATPAGSAVGAAKVRVRRSYPIGRADLTARLPGDTAHLAEAAVTVVGVGALGGPLAFELARAGVGRLHLIDGDAHDPATGARQIPTLRDAGSPKAFAVALRILDANPYVHLTAGMRDLGADGGRELPGLAASSLVVDCSANPTATRYLAAHLRATGTPLLVATATAGGWGGTITTLPSFGGGCWECLQLHRADRSLPWPPAQPDGWVIPAGCSERTFAGGAFDLAEVTLQAVRTALTRLAPDDGTVRQRSPFGDVQVLSLRGRRGPQQPRWQSRRLTVHPGCPLHFSGTGAHRSAG